MNLGGAVTLSLFAITGGALLKPAYYLASDPVDTGEALQCWRASEEPPEGDYRAALLDAREFGAFEGRQVQTWVSEQIRGFEETLS